MQSRAYNWLVNQYRHVLDRMRIPEYLEENPLRRGQRARTAAAAGDQDLKCERLEDRVMLTTTVFGIPNWSEQGPGPLTGGQVAGIPNQPVTGAIQAVVADPDL